MGYHEFENAAYCAACFDKIALKPCHGCGKGITERAMKAMGNYWHVKCLVCQVICN